MTRARAGPGEWVEPLLKGWAAEAGVAAWPRERRGLRAHGILTGRGAARAPTPGATISVAAGRFLQLAERHHAAVQRQDLVDGEPLLRDVLEQAHIERARRAHRRHVRCRWRVGVGLDQELNPASLYEAFTALEARRLVERFEWHYTPKHGSWLNMAESELAILSNQCLHRRIPDRRGLKRQVDAWLLDRNTHNVKADWRFTAADARIKLNSLYPAL